MKQLMMMIIVTLSTSDAVGEEVARAASESARLKVRSTGREVKVELRSPKSKRSYKCRTPCDLELPPGSYRARVDGIGRRLQLDAGETQLTVRPTRWFPRILGFAAVVAGGVGLTLAGAWSIRLDDDVRLYSALGGLGLTLLAAPLIRWSSPRLSRHGPPTTRPREWGRVELQARAEYLARSSTLEPEWGVGVGAGYFVLPDLLSLNLKGSVADGTEGFGSGYQVRAGTRIQGRVPLAFLFAGAAVGYGSSPRDDGFLLEVEAGLRLAASRRVAPEVTLAYQLTQGETWGHHLRVGAGVALSF